ncbi:MAG: LuxR C-terminal-related transcriptional regulator [Cyanobacteria bacterium J06621_8]
MEAEQLRHEAFLSSRELEIVELVVTGLSNHKIAQALEISKRTVDNHISNILKKTGTINRVELVRWSLQWGKVCLESVNCCTLPSVEQGMKHDEVVS